MSNTKRTFFRAMSYVLCSGYILTIASCGEETSYSVQEITNVRAPGEWVEGEEKDTYVRTKAAAISLPPRIKGCITSTPDFVVTGSESVVSGDEHCFPSNGAGVFGPKTNIPGLNQVDGMDVADMDGDGDNDFLVCDGLSGTVFLYTQDPANVFTPTVAATGITSGSGGSIYCTNLREADFDGDGLKDFVVGDNRVTNGMYVYRQWPAGSFTKVASGLDVSWASPSGEKCNCLFGVAAGDVDGDSHKDVLVLGYTGKGAGQVHFYKGTGTGAMAAPILKFTVADNFPVVTTPTGLGLFDLEDDGDLDIIVGGSSDGTHYVYRNDGAGNFTPPSGPAFDTDNFSGIDAYDFDGDGDDDLVLAGWSLNSLLYAENMGGSLNPTPAVVGALDGPSIGIGAPKLVGNSPFDLDHFKCYVAKGKDVGESVFLKDQFGSGEAVVKDPARFCNPVAKTHNDHVTGIKNKDHHLKFYNIESKEKTPVRVVRVSNQFVNEETIEVTDAIFLAVPAQKIKPGDHPAPVGLDHFKCYSAKGKPLEDVVDLSDQFYQERDVKVLDPVALCNPVEKTHKDKVTPIGNPEAHLMCYKIVGTPYETEVFSRDQFGEESIPIMPADLLCVPTQKTLIFQEPNITQLCGDRDAIDFDGGMVLPGNSGTGLFRQSPNASWPDGRPRRPCGEYVPVDGYLPFGGVTRFRIAYRKHTDPVPALGTAPGIQTRWTLRDRSAAPFCTNNNSHILETSGAQAWMDAPAYLEAKNGGPSTDWCPNSGLRLAVWDSADKIGAGPPDKDGHYVLWLEWEDSASVLHKEPFEHHLQLDNTLPEMHPTDGLVVTTSGGATAVTACGAAPAGDIFKVYGQFKDVDDFYWGYKIRISGGSPPKTIVYPNPITYPADDPDSNYWHDYYDGTTHVVNTDNGGTTPDSTTVFLRDIDMNDFGASFVDCCYLLELSVRDASIKHSFNHRVANENTGAWWDDVSQFITFTAAPASP